ncbi:head morphogenesis protein [Deinococcus aerius]|uniref:Head morphogenesis protein n=1 Tax=Deinococcus aerius TaxID=200253 RepID=A0A2I9CVA3_9DEIO|nr:minor capsid protein [Deinococcus aerius]GBF05854.1 head morphogenesis protein [Deinococcus aerius]
MSDRVIERILRDLEKRGNVLEAQAIRAVVRLYGSLDLAGLIALLRAATEEDSPLARARYMDRLMEAWDVAAGILGEAPDDLAQAVRGAVQSGITGTAEMFAASQVVTDAFTVPATLQLRYMQHAEARMREFWGGEPPQLRKEVQAAIRDGLERGQGIDQITRRIRDRASVSRSRATLIARNEVGNAAGFAMRESQKEAGCTHYIWRSASDDRVRPEHKARNGKVFAWNKPPADGHPGEPINCRCVALALPPGQTTA